MDYRVDSRLVVGVVGSEGGVQHVVARLGCCIVGEAGGRQPGLLVAPDGWSSVMVT